MAELEGLAPVAAGQHGLRGALRRHVVRRVRLDERAHVAHARSPKLLAEDAVEEEVGGRVDDGHGVGEGAEAFTGQGAVAQSGRVVLLQLDHDQRRCREHLHHPAQRNEEWDGERIGWG